MIFENPTEEMGRRYPELDADHRNDSMRQAVGLADEELWEMGRERGLAPREGDAALALELAALALREPTGRSIEIILNEFNVFKSAHVQEELDGQCWERLGEPGLWSLAAVKRSHGAACAVDARKWVEVLRSRPDGAEQVARLGVLEPWGLALSDAPEFQGALSSVAWKGALLSISKEPGVLARKASIQVARWRSETASPGRWLAEELDKELVKALRARIFARLPLGDVLEAAAALGPGFGLGRHVYANVGGGYEREASGLPPGWGRAYSHAQGDRREVLSGPPACVGLTCLVAGSVADVQAAASLGWIEPLRLVDASKKQSELSPARALACWASVKIEPEEVEKLRALGDLGFALRADFDEDGLGDKVRDLLKKDPQLASLELAQQIKALSESAAPAAPRGVLPRL